MNVVLLGHVQVERPVAGIAREAAEVGVAPVADRDLRKQRVEEGVDERRDHETGVVRGEGSQDGAHRHDGQPGLLVEITLQVEHRAAAGGAALDDARLAQLGRERERCLGAAGTAPAPAVQSGHRFPAAAGAPESNLGPGYTSRRHGTAPA